MKTWRGCEVPKDKVAMPDPLPDAAMVAANLRQMAKDLIRQAERLEMTLPARRPWIGDSEFLFTKKKLAEMEVASKKRQQL